MGIPSDVVIMSGTPKAWRITTSSRRACRPGPAQQVMFDCDSGGCHTSVFIPVTGIGHGASLDRERGREREGWQAEGSRPRASPPYVTLTSHILALSMPECQKPRGMPRGVSKTARPISASTVGDSHHRE